VYVEAAHLETRPKPRGEFRLLCAFLSSPRRVLTRDQLLELSRLHCTEVCDRSIDVQIMRLRRKIQADRRAPELIKPQRGVGYFFDETSAKFVEK
jgi:DNA-binding response OmpR family regulator